MKYTNYDNLPLALTVQELASALSIGKNSAYELIRCGKIRSIRVGHKIRIPKAAVKTFLEEK